MPEITYNHKVLLEYRRRLRRQMTPPEIILWSFLKGNNFGVKIRRQHSIGPYIVDFYCPKKRLVIEVDGDQHGEVQQRERDSIRDKYLKGCGLRVLRLSARAIVVNRYGVMDTIHFALRYP